MRTILQYNYRSYRNIFIIENSVKKDQREMRAVWGGLANRHKRNKILYRGVCGPDHSATENSRCCTAAAKSLQLCRQIYGETVEKVSDFILGGSKITTDGDCSHEIKRRSLLGRKVMTNLDSILKSTDITLPTKVRLVKTTVLPVLE